MPLHVITSLGDPLLRLIEDDPIRPEIPRDFRVSANSLVFVLQDSATLEPLACVCVALRDFTPADILELARDPEGDLTTAVFYTIWSYRAGAARRLLTQTVTWLRKNYRELNCYVTLSPQTDMAHTFHTRNGALEWRRNGDTVNYLYSLSDHTDNQ